MVTALWARLARFNQISSDVVTQALWPQGPRGTSRGCGSSTWKAHSALPSCSSLGPLCPKCFDFPRVTMNGFIFALVSLMPCTTLMISGAFSRTCAWTWVCSFRYRMDLLGTGCLLQGLFLLTQSPAEAVPFSFSPDLRSFDLPF